MRLDLATLMTMESLVAACVGVILLVAWLKRWGNSALALWGAADMSAAFGMLVLSVGATLGETKWSSMAGGIFLALSPGLTWLAAQRLDGRRIHASLALLGAVIVVAIPGAFPGARASAGSLLLATAAVYVSAAATTLWFGRGERLSARWPLIILAAIHAPTLGIGAYCTSVDAIDQNAAAPVASLFGFLHFESIVFGIGAAAFLLALVKEREEAASRRAASLDPLTGVANRAAFMNSAERVFEAYRRDGAAVSVLMFDLDSFKAVNDTYGHAAGDAVIRKFCEAAGGVLRSSEVLGRMGGEEFAVVLPGYGADAASLCAERIRASFAKGSRVVGDCEVNATVSGGVTTSLNSAETLQTLLEQSDAALYRAKADGGNCIRRYDAPHRKGDRTHRLRVA